MSDNITVANGATLTIEPGVIVKFGSGKSLLVSGTLNAVGTETDKIYFTSYRDDALGGDTNNDGPSSGSAGDWDRISLAGAGSVLNYTVIKYGGYNSYAVSAAAAATISNSAMTYNSNAISCSNAISVTISSNTISNNTGTGIWCENTVAALISSNTITTDISLSNGYI